MNNKAHLRPKDFDSNGDIIPMACKEVKGDLISRKWLTDAIRNRRTYLSYEDAKDVIDLIDNAPTVEIPTELCKGCRFLKDCETCGEKIRPQGEWICKDKVDGHMFGYSCSNCRNPEWQITNFCPNCGAKMKGGADNDV